MLRQAIAYPGVAQLVGRLVWDQDAASSSLATRTMKNGCFRKKTTVFWTFKRILACCPGTAWSTLLWFRFFEKKLEWKIQPGGKTEENYHIFMSLP